MQESKVATAFGWGHGALQHARIGGLGAGIQVEVLVNVFARSAQVIAVGVALTGATAAWGQNLSAGKTAAQLFSQTCQACHAKPGVVSGAATANRSLEGFLRQHYTSSREDAALLAAFVRGAPAEPAAKGRQTATTRPGIPTRDSQPPRRTPGGSEQVRVPDDRATGSRSKRQQKPDESRPTFDASPAAAPAMPPVPAPAAADTPKPAPEPPATAQAPAPVEPARPAAEPAPATQAAEPPKDQDRPPTDAAPAATPPPAAPAASGSGGE